MVQEHSNIPFSDLSRFDFKGGAHRIRHDNDREVGYEAFYPFQEGMLLRVMDLSPLTNSPCATCVPHGQLVFCFKLLGNNFLEAEGHEPVNIRQGSMWLGYSEQQLVLRESCEAGQSYQMVMLICEPGALLRPPFSMEAEDLPACIQGILNGAPTHMEEFTMSNDLLQTLKVMLNNNPLDSWNRAFLQAKTIEILCLALGVLSQQENSRLQDSISDKDRRAMEAANALLLEHWRSPPSLDELVKVLGVGKSRIKENFKLIYGVTISEFLIGIRMQKAQRLLIEGQQNMTQIADALGYEHSSNFSSAFKRYFGMSPRDFQKTAGDRTVLV